MNAPESAKTTESRAIWEHPVSPDHPEETADPAADTSLNQKPQPELAWLKEIGWYSRSRSSGAGEIDHHHRAAPMHRRESLSDVERLRRLAAGIERPRQNSARTRPSGSRGSLAPFVIGAIATLIGVISFIAVFDITSGGQVRKTLASIWRPAATRSTPPVETTTIAIEERTPSSAQAGSQETIKLVETKPAIVEQKAQQAADPLQTGSVEPSLKEAPPVAKTVQMPPARPAEVPRAAASASVQKKPEPLPVAIVPPPEIEPAVAVSVAPEPPAPVVSKPAKPTVIALASPPALQKISPAERDVFQDCDNCPEMVVVQTGQFQMGAAAGDSAALPNELPAHQVSITKPFAIGRYEVTIKSWDLCVADKICQPLTLGEGWNTPQQPAMHVSWDEITEQYLPWLSKTTGKSYRLPTEAEWEYAARGGGGAGSISAGSSGAEALGSLATTVAVGSRKPNSLGLYDMQGNVWEWVQDCWNASYKETPVDGGPATSGDCTLRVARGGSWASSSASLRATKRGWNKPTTQNNTLGFRVVRSL